MSSSLDLHPNHYLRKCFFKREPQVPTQTEMKNIMKPPLANVYFKSMGPKLRELAGLEPPLKGGGSDWYQPPDEILEGRHIMRPIKKEHLNQLCYLGIDAIGERVLKKYQRELEIEQFTLIYENDLNWQRNIEKECTKQWQISSRSEAASNTAIIIEAFRQYSALYKVSINKIEEILSSAAIKKIKNLEHNTYRHMSNLYQDLLHKQATMLYDRYYNMLENEKAIMKEDFIRKIEQSKMELNQKIHDLNVDKHVAIEKLRHLLECQKMACQVYAALKEKETCEKEVKDIKYAHKKKIKILDKSIKTNEIEIKIARERSLKKQEFINIWKKKVCHVVKKFQVFVTYCLRTLPECADFFIDMEKLLLLQLNDVADNPTAPSMIQTKQEPFHEPEAHPKPFILFGDMRFPPFDESLCPKVVKSDTSDLPVVVINKRYIYAACDNFQRFTEKINEFGEIYDETNYDGYEPLKYTEEKRLSDLKNESSMMKILQNEMPNTKDVNTDCCLCKLPFCFCNPQIARNLSISSRQNSSATSSTTIDSGRKITERSTELKHERDPNWPEYLEYIKSKKCSCAKTTIPLSEKLPPYMRQTSAFMPLKLTNYERCPLPQLKHIVKLASCKRYPGPPDPERPASKIDICTQWSDDLYEKVCSCYTDAEMEKLYKELQCLVPPFSERDTTHDTGSTGPRHYYLDQNTQTFAEDRAMSLRKLVDKKDDLIEIFRKKDC